MFWIHISMSVLYPNHCTINTEYYSTSAGWSLPQVEFFLLFD